MHVATSWLFLFFFPLTVYLPVQQESVVQAARPLPGNPPPSYPKAANEAMVVGDVIFRALLTEKGRVKSVSILKVPEEDMGFEDAVRKAVSRWRFEPARKGNEPIITVYVGKVSFSLRPADEEAIRNIVVRWVKAWNQGDAKAIASLFDSEGRIHSESEITAGADEVEGWFADRLTGKYKETRLQVEVDNIRFVSHDFAKVNQSFEIVHVSNEDISPVKGQHSLFMFQGEGGRWSVLLAALTNWQKDLTENGRFQMPKLIKHVRPSYTDDALRRGVQGTVILEAVIDQQGNAIEIKVIHSIPALDNAAIEAVQQWRFEPGSIHGVPVRVVSTIEVHFKLLGRP